MQKKGFLEWHELEHQRSEKSPDWYWAVGIITVAAAITAIIFNNILFAIVIIVGSFVLTMHAIKEPPVRHYRVTERGIHIDNIFYPYSNLRSFWVEEDPYDAKLIVRSAKLLSPYLIVPLPDDMDTDVMHDYLVDHLEAEELHEPVLHKVAEYLGF